MQLRTKRYLIGAGIAGATLCFLLVILWPASEPKPDLLPIAESSVGGSKRNNCSGVPVQFFAGKPIGFPSDFKMRVLTSKRVRCHKGKRVIDIYTIFHRHQGDAYTKLRERFPGLARSYVFMIQVQQHYDYRLGRTAEFTRPWHVDDGPGVKKTLITDAESKPIWSKYVFNRNPDLSHQLIMLNFFRIRKNEDKQNPAMARCRYRRNINKPRKTWKIGCNMIVCPSKKYCSDMQVVLMNKGLDENLVRSVNRFEKAVIKIMKYFDELGRENARLAD